jgi:predicted esterase
MAARIGGTMARASKTRTRSGEEYGSSVVRRALWFAVLVVPASAGAARWEDLPRLVREASSYEAMPPARVPRGTLTSILHHLEVAQEFQGSESENAKRFLDTAGRYLAKVREGVDPYAEARRFVVRGYRSRLSRGIQPYSIYVPPSYDPTRPTPLLFTLHGGSSNHSLFLAVTFGNDETWTEYRRHWRDPYQPQWDTDFLVVSPNGFGQVMWRWYGEDDVLDVLEDVARHYNVDRDRVYLSGLSNGGVGTYSIGARHAWRFAAVIAMAGAPSWIQYHAQRLQPWETPLFSAQSAMQNAENFKNTDLRFYHGINDPGPMRPDYPRQFQRVLDALGIPYYFHEFDLGHDVLYAVHQRGALYRRLSKVRRNPKPSEVWLSTWDYRAARQHWLELERFASYPGRALVKGKVVDDRRLVVTTENAARIRVHVADVPFAQGGEVRIEIDGHEAWTGVPGDEPLSLEKAENGWRAVEREPRERVKRPGLSGPITDVLRDPVVHVYGTRVEGEIDAMRHAAQVGAHGWPLWSLTYDAPVLPEDDVDLNVMRTHHVVLYGTRQNSALLDRVADQLPIRVERGAIVLGDRRFDGDDVGTRFIYPNPLAPERYLVVQAGNTADAVVRGNNLPDFLPDWVVYDGSTTLHRERLACVAHCPPAAGYFDARWRLPGNPRD